MIRRSPGRSLKSVLVDIRAAFPGVDFAVREGRKGYRVITWTGGPHVPGVELAAMQGGLMPLRIAYDRAPTPEEFAAMQAEWDREDAERQAAEPARRAAAKAAGLAKRQATVARRRELQSRLAAEYPDTTFTVEYERNTHCLAWTGGPSVETVAKLTGLSLWVCTRTDSAKDIAARAALEAEAERLACEATEAAIAQAQAQLAQREHARRVRLDTARLQPALPLPCPCICAASFGPLPEELLERYESTLEYA